MRGKANAANDNRAITRITPAHAGKRQRDRAIGLYIEDHPRTCGEKFNRAAADSEVLGSPPHMRGKANQLEVPEGLFWITPAHAGKRLKSCE